MAPELDGLGKLVDADQPHIYIEGTRDSDTYVQFDEAYTSSEISFGGKPIPTFQSDPKNRFPGFLRTHGINPDSFLLHIYSINDHDVYGKVFENYTLAELLFFTTRDNGYHAYSLRGGHYALHLNPLRHHYRVHPNLRDAFSFYRDKTTTINPATTTEMGIVHESLMDARSRIS